MKRSAAPAIAAIAAVVITWDVVMPRLGAETICATWRRWAIRRMAPMTFSLRILFAVVAVVCGVIVLIKAASDTALIATGIGLIAAGVGLVAP